jgi:hypothetical protein
MEPQDSIYAKNISSPANSGLKRRMADAMVNFRQRQTLDQNVNRYDEVPPNDVDERRLQQPPRSLRETLTNAYLNVLLLFAPLGIVAGALRWDVRAIFTLNFLAIVPLSRLLALLLRELSSAAGRRTSRALGMIVCNGVEMLVRQYQLDDILV